jgi:DNA-binding transcriptional LysR family regulator
MKQNFTIRQGALDGVEAFLSVAQHLSFRRAAAELGMTVPRAVMPILLEPLIASFCQAYPEVEVEIAASEELVDLAAEGFDAGIRRGQFIAADMVAVRLTIGPRLSSLDGARLNAASTKAAKAGALAPGIRPVG